MTACNLAGISSYFLSGVLARLKYKCLSALHSGIGLFEH